VPVVNKLLDDMTNELDPKAGCPGQEVSGSR
jgi:hypothetical protein